MDVIIPITITDATLTSSNVNEIAVPPRTNWDSGTPYFDGDTVQVTTPDIHRNYEALQDNTNQFPPDDDVNNPIFWLFTGPTNRWAMFDSFVNSQTSNPNTIEVEVTLGELANSVSILNVFGATAQVIVTDPVEGEVYNETIVLTSDSGINDWYAYFFTPVQRQTDVVFLDLPAFPNATIKVIITEQGGTVLLGVLAFGVQRNIGITDHGTGIGIIDYSTKGVDSFGNFVIQERSFSKRADYIVTVDTDRVSSIQTFLASIRSTPAIWVGNENFGSTIIYGYYRDYDIILSSPIISDCNIVVEGLT